MGRIRRPARRQFSSAYDTKGSFQALCMRLRISASLGEATWLHCFPPAMKRREIHASLGEATWLHPFPPAMKRREIHASLGEAARLHACSPAKEATNSALALERLHTTLRRFFFGKTFRRQVSFPVFASYRSVGNRFSFSFS